MADKRMFSKKIIDSDEFLEMPLSTQSLYFHLSMRADDDGFINNAKRIARLIGASEDDLKLLIMKRFILIFESGVIVIKHWKIHNYIQKDRYKETLYTEEKNQLFLKDNKAYTFESDGNTPCIQNGYKMDTQIRLDKNRLVENKEDNNCELKTLFDEFEEEFKRPLSSIEFQTIIEFQKTMSDDLIKLALTEAVKSNARSFKYIETILRNWNGAGIKTTEEAVKHINRFRNKQSNNNSNKQDRNLPQWYIDQQNGVEEEYEKCSPEELAELEKMLAEL